MAANGAKVASVRCRAVRVEPEHADGVARGEGNGGRDRVDARDANARGVESRYGCIAPGGSGIVRVIVRDVADDGDGAVGQATERSRRRLAAVETQSKLVDFGPHLRGAGPDPIAPSTFSRTRSAPARNGLSDGAMLSGSGRMPNERQSVSAADRAHLGSRLVPSVTSPPAQTRNGAESGLGFVDSIGVDGADCASAIEPNTRIVNDEKRDDPAFTAVR